jgi:NitT/TauT family transport system substrate-binding protein
MTRITKHDAKRRTTMLAGLAVAATAAFSSPACMAQAGAPAGTPAHFRVSVLKGNALSYVPIVAQQIGAWARHGLAVEYVNVASGPAFISSVQSGSADGGPSAFALVLPAQQRGGKPLIAIAGDVGAASYTIAVRPGLEGQVKGDWRQVAQALKGKKFGVPSLGGEVAYVFQGLMQAAGIDPAKDLTVVQAGAINAAMASLRRGDIDAYIGSVHAQLLGLQELGFAKIVLDLNDAEPFKVWTQTQFFVSEEMVKKHPDVVKSVQAALKETHAWIQDPRNFDRALKIANEIFPVSAPAMKDMISRFRYRLDRKAVEANLAFFEKSGVIKGPVRYEDTVFAD